MSASLVGLMSVAVVALAPAPADSDAELKAARKALQQHDYAAAHQQLTKLLRSSPGSAETHLLAARAARGVGLYDEAEKHLKECRRLKGPAEALALEEKLLTAQGGDPEAVEKALLAAVKDKHPESGAILEALARGYADTFRPAEALKVGEAWLEWQPDAVPALLLRARIKERTNAWARGPVVALDDYRRAVEVAPDNVAARLGLAQALLQGNQANEALEQFECLAKLRPKDPAVRRGLADCRILLGQMDEAKRILDKLLADHPKDPAALLARGKAAMQVGQVADAETILLKALAVEPRNRQANYALYVCLKLLGKEAEARQRLERVRSNETDIKRLDEITTKIEQSPRDPALCAEAGTLLLRDGRDREGLLALRRALKLDPKNRAAHQALADYYQRIGDKERAAQHRRLAQPTQEKKEQ